MGPQVLEQKKEIVDKLNSFVKNKSGFLLMSGKNGTGKTFAAEAIRGIFENILPLDLSIDSTLFYTQSELNICWGSSFPNIHALLEKIISCGLFILDDLGTRTPSDSFMDFLYAIVDWRWKQNKPTIITTNLNAKQMREQFGEAFFSRVASGISIVFEGRDRRFDEKTDSKRDKK